MEEPPSTSLESDMVSADELENSYFALLEQATVTFFTHLENPVEENKVAHDKARSTLDEFTHANLHLVNEIRRNHNMTEISDYRSM